MLLKRITYLLTLNKLRLLFVNACSLLFLWSNGQSINLNVGGETGTVASGLTVPLVERYSKNGSSSVVNSSGTPYTANALHYISADSVSWAREGNFVLKFYGDGGSFPSYDYAYRVELATSPTAIGFSTGEERFYSLSFFLADSIWDNQTQYSTVISQWKQYGGGNPNMEVRLSNTGDYKLTIRSPRNHFSTTGSEGDLIGYAKPDEWNDIKYYVKHSTGNDGALKIWLNGDLVFNHSGATLYKTGDGYIKFGMYTEIRDERIMYWDAINITDSITSSLAVWSQDRNHLPTISLDSPTDQAHLASGSSSLIEATANDPAGKKLNTPGLIDYVQFYANDSLLYTDSISPYNFSWSPIDGPYTLFSLVKDQDSNVTYSDTVNVYVGPKPPTVEIISPNHLENFGTLSAISISADAQDIDGTISEVSLYIDTTLLGTLTAAPYSWNWTPNDTGAYIISALAIDTDGKVSAPDIVGITVGATIDTSTVTVIHDASIRESSPNSTGNWSKIEVYSNSNTIAGILKFSLNGLDTLPEIRDAHLELYTFSVNDTVAHYLHKITDNGWDESTVTWNTAPVKGALLDKQNIATVNTRYSFNITSYLNETLASGDSTIGFWIEDPNNSYTQVQFDSKVRPNPPVLSIISSSIDGANDTTDIKIFLGDTEFTSPIIDVDFYPIPASQFMNISCACFTDNDLYQLLITDMNGKVVRFSTHNSTNTIRIETGLLPAGTYIVTLQHKSKDITIRRKIFITD